jgi:hypothetical protein
MPHAQSAARAIGSPPPVAVSISAGKKAKSKKAKASDVDHSSASAGAGRRNTKEDRMKERREEDRKRVLLFCEDKPTAKDVHEFFVGRVSALLAEHI